MICFVFKLIDPKYFTDLEDKLIIKNALNGIIKLLNQLKPSVFTYFPIQLPISFESQLKYLSNTYYHACCTLAMNNNNDHSIINDNLQVKYINNLRIIDASILPNIIASPIAVICMIFGYAIGKQIIGQKRE